MEKFDDIEMLVMSEELLRNKPKEFLVLALRDAYFLHPDLFHSSAIFRELMIMQNQKIMKNHGKSITPTLKGAGLSREV